MTFVITDGCIGTTDKSCVEVCPVDCIYEIGQDTEIPDQPLMLIIDPEECIDCGACLPECPVEAILIDDNVPETQQGYAKLAEMHVGRGANDGPDEESRMAKADIAEKAIELHSHLIGTS